MRSRSCLISSFVILSAFFLLCSAALAQPARPAAKTAGQDSTSASPAVQNPAANASQPSGSTNATNGGATAQTAPQPAVVVMPDPVRDAVELSKKGEILLQEGKNAEAVGVLRKSLAMLESRFGPNSIQLGSVLNNLARATELQGKLIDAEPIYRRCVLIYEAALGATDPETCSIRINLANLLVQNGKALEAQVQYEQALPILETTLGNHPAMIQSMETLAGLYEKQRNYARCAELLERVLAQLEVSNGKQSASLVPVLKKISKCYLKQERPDLAEPKLAQLKSIKEVCSGENSPEVVTAINELAAVTLQQGKVLEAQVLYERAVAILNKNANPDNAMLIPVLSNLAGIYLTQNKPDAELIYCRVIELQETSESASYADDLIALAGLYSRQGQLASAEPLFERALSVLERKSSGDPRLIATTRQLGSIYESQGKQLEALALYERTAALTGVSKQSLRPDTLPNRFVPVSQTQSVPQEPKTRMQKLGSGMRTILRVTNSVLGLPGPGR